MVIQGSNFLKTITFLYLFLYFRCNNCKLINNCCDFIGEICEFGATNIKDFCERLKLFHDSLKGLFGLSICILEDYIHEVAVSSLPEIGLRRARNSLEFFHDSPHKCNQSIFNLVRQHLVIHRCLFFVKDYFNNKLILLRRHETSCEFENSIKEHSSNCVF